MSDSWPHVFTGYAERDAQTVLDLVERLERSAPPRRGRLPVSDPIRPRRRREVP